MQGLYTAIGKIAAAAHANGDSIDENIFPTDDGSDQHGIDVYHGNTLVLFRAAKTEPRFAVLCPVLFAGFLRQRYTDEELSDRANVDVTTVSAEERQRIVESAIQTDLQEIASYEEQFESVMHDTVDSGPVELLRATYGQQDHWNGIVVRDRCFPYREEFDVSDYRDVITRVTTIQSELVEVAHQEIPLLNGDRKTQERSIEDPKPTQPSGFE